MWFAKSIADYLGISSFFLLLHIGLGGGGGGGGGGEEEERKEQMKIHPFHSLIMWKAIAVWGKGLRVIKWHAWMNSFAVTACRKVTSSTYI